MYTIYVASNYFALTQAHTYTRTQTHQALDLYYEIKAENTSQNKNNNHMVIGKGRHLRENGKYWLFEGWRLGDGRSRQTRKKCKSLPFSDFVCFFSLSLFFISEKEKTMQCAFDFISILELSSSSSMFDVRYIYK